MYRGWIRGKTRIALAWLFAALLVLSAHEYPKWHGITLCFLGAALRFWASGYLRKDTRPAVGGPYAYVRNPLYLGTYLMAVGTALSIESWWLLAVITVAFAAVYHFIILDEEAKLQKIFGDSYREYCAQVPRFFPRIWPPLKPLDEAGMGKVNPEAAHWRYSSDLATKNKAYEAFLSFAGLIGFVAAVTFVKNWLIFGH